MKTVPTPIRQTLLRPFCRPKQQSHLTCDIAYLATCSREDFLLRWIGSWQLNCARMQSISSATRKTKIWQVSLEWLDRTYGSGIFLNLRDWLTWRQEDR